VTVAAKLLVAVLTLAAAASGVLLANAIAGAVL
jgi:hypothetical protein